MQYTFCWRAMNEDVLKNYVILGKSTRQIALLENSSQTNVRY